MPLVRKGVPGVLSQGQPGARHPTLDSSFKQVQHPPAAAPPAARIDTCCLPPLRFTGCPTRSVESAVLRETGPGGGGGSAQILPGSSPASQEEDPTEKGVPGLLPAHAE